MIKQTIKDIQKYIPIFIFTFLLIFNLNIIFAQGTGGEEQQPPSNTFIQKGLGGIMGNLTPSAKELGYRTDNVSIEATIGSVIQIVLSFIGIFFLILIIVSGIQWMFAGGNEEVVSKSKARIKNATFGLAIIFAAYAITMFITNLFIDKTGFSQ